MFRVAIAFLLIAAAALAQQAFPVDESSDSLPVKKRPSNTSAALATQTPCFRLRRANKGFRFIQVSKGGFTADVCETPGCYRFRKATPDDRLRWKAFRCKDRQGQRRCFRVTKCKCVGKWRWISAPYGITLYPSTSPQTGMVSLEHCDGGCFNFDHCVAGRPCYRIGGCATPPGRPPSCRVPVPCEYDEPPGTTPAPCSGNLIRFERAEVGVTFIQAPTNVQGVSFHRCPNPTDGTARCFESRPCKDGKDLGDGGQVDCFIRKECQSSALRCNKVVPCES